MNIRLATLLLVAALAMMPRTAFSADVFYEQRFKAGQTALLARNGVEAAEELRIAAFGFLNEPDRLSVALAWLAVAYHGLGRSEDLDATLKRFVALENRFGAYRGTDLDPQVRSAFETVLLARVGKPALARISSLASLAGVPAVPAQTSAARTTTPAATPPQPAPAQQAPSVSQAAGARQQPAQPAAAPPTAVRPAATHQSATQPATRQSATSQPATSQPAPSQPMTPQPAPPQPATSRPATSQAATSQPAPSPQPATPPAATPQPAASQPAASQPAATRTATQQPATQPAPAAAEPQTSQPSARRSTTAAELETVRNLIQNAKYAQAVEVLSPALARDPGNRDVRVLMLHSATLAKRYELAAAQVPALSPLPDNDPVSVFYAAVAMYETNQSATARLFMQRALPRLKRTAFVEAYAARILPPTP